MNKNPQSQAELIKDIRRRFCLCSMHFLWTEYQRTDEKTNKGKQHFMQLALDDSRSHMKIRRWIYYGSVYNALAESLGGYGALFFLPVSIPRTTWEAHIHRTTPRFKNVISHLRALGIDKMANSSHEVADSAISIAAPQTSAVVRIRAKVEGDDS